MAKVMANYPPRSPCPTCGNRQMLMPIAGRVRSIDYCIGHIVAALNAANITTTACCCGHGEQDGMIGLEDGRVLIVKSLESQIREKEAQDAKEGREHGS